MTSVSKLITADNRPYVWNIRGRWYTTYRSRGCTGEKAIMSLIGIEPRLWCHIGQSITLNGTFIGFHISHIARSGNRVTADQSSYKVQNGQWKLKYSKVKRCRQRTSVQGAKQEFQCKSRKAAVTLQSSPLSTHPAGLLWPQLLFYRTPALAPNTVGLVIVIVIVIVSFTPSQSCMHTGGCPRGS